MLSSDFSTTKSVNPRSNITPGIFYQTIHFTQIMKIAIASGKGGTGKTTVAINLYYFLSKALDNQVQLIDCDVEEPNAALFFENIITSTAKDEYTLLPEIDTAKCTYCKKCVEWCEFNAITLIKNLAFAEINADLCHSCGACLLACKHKAIIEKPNPLGTISEFDTGFGLGLTEGRLKVGSAMQTALIKKVKQQASKKQAVSIFDAPPGTSCPVVETVSDADYVILVSEPTPFGVHDLKLAVDLLEELKKPFGVIVNKAGLGNDEIYDFLHEKHIHCIAKLPFSEQYATQYSKGELLTNIDVSTQKHYEEIAQYLCTKMKLTC